MLKNLSTKYETLIFYDCETTGFDAVETGDQMIELGAIVVANGQEVESMDEFVQLHNQYAIPGLPTKITELTNITDQMLAENGKSEEQVLARFMAYFHGRTLLVAYNAQFDLIFLAQAIIRYREYHPEWLRLFNQADYLDPCSVHRDRARRAKSHKLEAAIEYFNLQDRVINSHRAIDDARALMEVTQALDAEGDDLEWYVNRFAWVKKPPEHPLKKVSYYDLSPWHSLPSEKLYERTTR